MMESKPIKKVVTLVWDQDTDRWRDQETGVLVTGISPLYATSEFDEDKALDSEPLIGFHGSTPIPSDEWTSLTFKQVQAMIDEAFDRRIASGSTLHYFADPLDDNLIVPYRFHRSLANRITELRNEVIEFWDKEADDRLRLYDMYTRLVNRPWWKLW